MSLFDKLLENGVAVEVRGVELTILTPLPPGGLSRSAGERHVEVGIHDLERGQELFPELVPYLASPYDQPGNFLLCVWVPWAVIGQLLQEVQP